MSATPGGPFAPTHAEALRRLEAVNPHEYARSRNALDGAVTGLSPYLAHGVIGMREAIERIALRHPIGFADKLAFEFGWREFFHHVWSHCGDAVLRDMHPAELWPGRYADALPADIREGRTGVPVVDAAVRQLYATGYLHNHARMWLASYVVHLRKVSWRAGADWLYGHLLDGDVPSNHLSWQWVAATFSRKPYLFNAENVARFAPQAEADAWLSPGTVIDTSYEALDHIARSQRDVGPERGVHAAVNEPPLLPRPPEHLIANAVTRFDAGGRPVRWVHPWQLDEPDANAAAARLGVIHLPAHAALPWSERRWRWVLARMADVTEAVFIGDVAKLDGGDEATTTHAPMPGYDAAFAGHAQLLPAPRWLPNPERLCSSFSRFYQVVQREAAPQA